MRHPAPPSGCADERVDGKSLVRPRVPDFQPGPVRHDQLRQARPQVSVFLRPASQGTEPQPLQAHGELPESREAGRDGEVIQPSVNHPAQPYRRRRHIVMHPSVQRLLQPLEGAPHPLRHRFASQQKSSSFSGLCAVMREAQEVEGLRSAQTSSLPLFRGIPPELDEPGLVGVYLQSEASEPILHGAQEPLRVVLVLEAHHEVVGVSNDDCVAFDLMAAPLLLEPQVEDVVQVDVRQGW